MQKYTFFGYDFFISDSLKPVTNESVDHFLLLDPNAQTICFSVKKIGNRLKLDSYFGLRHELKDNAIYIYQTTYGQGDEIDEEDETLPV